MLTLAPLLPSSSGARAWWKTSLRASSPSPSSPAPAQPRPRRRRPDRGPCAYKAAASAGEELAGHNSPLTDCGGEHSDPVPLSWMATVRIVVRAPVRATKIFATTPAACPFRRLPVAHPGSPPRRLPERPDDQHGRNRDRARRAARPERTRWQVDAFGPDDTDADLPPWAGLAGQAVRAGGTRRAATADPHAGAYAPDTRTRVVDGQQGGPGEPAADAPRSRMAVAPGPRRRCQTAQVAPPGLPLERR